MAHDKERAGVVEASEQSEISVSALSSKKVVLSLRLQEHTMSTEMTPDFARRLAKSLQAAALAPETGKAS